MHRWKCVTRQSVHCSTIFGRDKTHENLDVYEETHFSEDDLLPRQILTVSWISNTNTTKSAEIHTIAAPVHSIGLEWEEISIGKVLHIDRVNINTAHVADLKHWSEALNVRYFVNLNLSICPYMYTIGDGHADVCIYICE